MTHACLIGSLLARVHSYRSRCHQLPFEQALIIITPPFAYTGAGKIRKDTNTRPYTASKDLTAHVATEVIMPYTLLIHEIIFIDPGARVDNGYQVYTLLM